MDKLSVVIITFNEERNIRRCLESVLQVADEIVVVDSLSTDRTKQICHEYEVQFHEQKFLGYIEQKNFALKFATYDYVLSLDADEALSDELISSILKVKKDLKYGGYTMNRLTNYCGKWIHHCGWYPDEKLRLFKHELGSWGGVNPHDKFMFDKSVQTIHINGDLLHYSYYTLDDHFKQIERFTDIAAGELHGKGKKVSLTKLWLSPVVRFVRDYFFLSGFLDGKSGFRICRLSAYATYLKYKKLKKLGKTK